MTYNEWRDELKSNLLSVSESERRRVLDYYAEAYADRRDAGYSEREIIEDFGAPYDAARRILEEKRESYDDFYDEPPRSSRETRREDRERRREEERHREEERRREHEARREERRRTDESYDSAPPRRREDYTWVFVLLCVVFCVPLFGIIMGMVGITIGFCVAPFGVLIGGVTTIGAGIGAMVAGDIAGGLVTLGSGLIIFGVSIILLPLFVKLVKLMWKLFGKLFKWIKSLFSGKEYA